MISKLKMIVSFLVVPDKRPSSSSSSTCSLQTFAREVIDLLKQQTIHCRLPLSKFVTTYHMKYSRHCRSADYGFDKILDLLLAIPNAVQVKDFEFAQKIKNFEFFSRYSVMVINVY
jgi:hypothetical protein